MTKYELGNILIYEQPTKYIVKSENYDDSFPVPVLTPGQTFILGYTAETEGVYSAPLPVIIFDDFTTATKLVNFPFKVKSSAMKILKPANENVFLPYWYYFLSSLKVDNGLHKRYWISTFANRQVHCPSFQEQKRIAERLDKVQELIAKQKEQIAKLDLLIKSRFLDMFGDPISNPKKWVMKKLKECARTNLSYGSGAKAVNYNGTVRYIRITDIDNQGLLNKEKKSPSIFEEKYLLHPGDLLFARTGATVGKTFLYDKKYGMSVYAGYLIRFVPKIDLCHPLFVFYFTHTDYYKQFVLDKQKAVAQPNINAQEYGELLIPLPPLSLQTQFTNFVKSVEQQKEVFSTRLSHFETLYKSLMQEYFG